LVKSITHQVVAGRPSHMAGRPRGLVSTDFQLQISCYHLLESVTVKLTHERLQSGADQPGGLVHSRGDTYFGRIPNSLLIF
jgi:hypothetical protein